MAVESGRRYGKDRYDLPVAIRYEHANLPQDQR